MSKKTYFISQQLATSIKLFPSDHDPVYHSLLRGSSDAEIGHLFL